MFIICIFIFTSCEDKYDNINSPITYGDTYLSIDISTDKVTYKPGEIVYFTLKEKPTGDLKVRYSHLGQVIKENNLSEVSWSWTTPNEDYKGYLVDIYEIKEDIEINHHSISVDVSSNWTKFPRYGFLSSYGKLSKEQIKRNIEALGRFRINGVQFYDWMYDHHRPLAGTVDNTLMNWTDLIGRPNYYSTIQEYIEAIHNNGMKAMFYNLAFGALSNATSDGVKEEWYIFKDANRTEKDKHHLDPPFRSSIYLTNPGNPSWQDYLVGRHKDVYSVFPFDGYHIDQLGNRGVVYDYNGDAIKLSDTYASFIAAMKKHDPNKHLVMNAVSQYGQNDIAKADVDFLYTEVWDESKTFEQLAQVILDNNTYSGDKKQTVLAAYINYARSSSTGYVNAPGVLLTNAVIFSFGGAHIELGEHYLANEYFPNSNLQMKSELKKSLVDYYDYLTAYQNLLRDGGEFVSFEVKSLNEDIHIENWPASQGSIAASGKRLENRDVIHLINFSDTNTMDWRDTNGNQKEPVTITDLEVIIRVDDIVEKVWFASPDLNGGISNSLSFKQEGKEVRLIIPSLKYWDMVVFEY